MPDSNKTPPRGAPVDRRPPTYPPAPPTNHQATLDHWPPRLVTEHFSLSEFHQPAAPPEWGVVCAAQDYPAEWVADRLTPLCRVLERLRAELLHPITVLCGYRSALYNEAKRQYELRTRGSSGVAEFSQHIEGRAADIAVDGVPALTVHATALRLHRAGVLADLGGLGLYNSFVHVDVRPHKPGHLDQW